MNAKTAMPLLLVLMTAGTVTVVRGQDCSCNDFYTIDSASGKEVFETRTHGHEYRITSIRNKMTELVVDDKKVEESEFPKYAQVIEKIEHEMREDAMEAKRDEEEAAKDREEARRDQDEARRDQEEARRDQEQAREEARRDQEEARRDQEEAREEARRDQEEARRDRDEAKRDQEEARRDQEEARHEQEQASWDLNDAERDQEAAANDRAMMRALVSYIVSEGIVPNTENLKSLVLTDTAFIVNGVKQPQKQLISLKEKFGEWSRNGLSYGSQQARGTNVFFYKANFEE